MNKKNIIFIWVICFALIITGCSRNPMTINFSDKSTTVSNTFTINFSQEDMYKDKSYDILINAEEDNSTFVIYEDMGIRKSITLPQNDEWYSLTSLYYTNEENEEDFITYKDAVSITLIVESENKQNIRFRGVIGDEEDNAYGTGYILSNKKYISEIFDLEIKPKQE